MASEDEGKQPAKSAHEMLVHGLRCIAADGGTEIVYLGRRVMCDGAMCATLATQFLEASELRRAPIQAVA